MPRTVEHIVETHMLAAGRRKAGLPVWKYHVKVGPDFQNDDLPWQERRDLVVAAIKGSKWYRRQEEREESELWEFVEELSDVENIETFDFIWDQIYDLADVERCWLDVWS